MKSELDFETNRYHDILNCERPVSKTRKHMSKMERAAQFAPFAALTGLDEQMGEVADSVNSEQSETGRITAGNGKQNPGNKERND